MKNTISEKPVLFFEHPTEIQQITTGLNKTHAILREILTEWNKLTNNATLTVDNISRDFILINGMGSRIPAVDNVNNFVMAELIKDSPFYNVWEPKKLIDGMIKPDITPLIEAIKQLGEYIPGPGWKDTFRPQCFKIEGSDIVLIESKVNELKSAYSFWAETPAELHRLGLVENLIKQFNVILGEYSLPVERLAINGLTVGYDGKLFPSPDFIKKSTI